jgi:hypothetical protein
VFCHAVQALCLCVHCSNGSSSSKGTNAVSQAQIAAARNVCVFRLRSANEGFDRAMLREDQLERLRRKRRELGLGESNGRPATTTAVCVEILKKTVRHLVTATANVLLLLLLLLLTLAYSTAAATLLHQHTPSAAQLRR